MALRDRLRKMLGSGGGMHTPSWPVPAWNNPAGYEFSDAQRAMETAYLKLLDIEAQLDQTTNSGLAYELGDNYVAGGALNTKIRFESLEWRAAWQEFLDAVQKAETAAQNWKTQKKP